MSNGLRTTGLDYGDLVEVIGHYPKDGVGPLTTGRCTFQQFQSLLLGSTALVGMRFIALEGRVGTAETTIATHTGQITALQSSQSVGYFVYDTLAQLNANLVPVANSRAEVTSDGNNNGYYVKVGATGTGSWSRKSTDTFTGISQSVLTLKNLAAPATEYFGGLPIALDWGGVLGVVRTAYIPQQFYSASLKGGQVGPLTIGTQSTRVLGTYEIQIGTGGLYKVMLDRTTGVVTAYLSTALPALNDDMVNLFDVRATGLVSNARYPVVPLEGRGGFFLYRPIVIETDASGNPLICIGGSAWNSGYASAVRSVSSGTFEIEFTGFAPAGTAFVLWYDLAAAVRGVTPWKIAQGSSFPDSPLCRPILSKASATAPYQNHTGAPLLGVVSGGSVPNETRIGKNALELADILYPGNTYTTTATTIASVTLGLTRGIASTTGLPLYGNRLADRTPGRWVFVRVYLESDQDNDFGVPRAYFATESLTGNLSNALTLERQYSARLASFIGVFQVPVPDPTYGAYTGLIAGHFTPGRTITPCGLQISSGHRTRDIWITRDDYPDDGQSSQSVTAKTIATVNRTLEDVTGEIVHGPTLYMVQGRPLSLYFANLMAKRTNNANLKLSLEPRVPLNGDYPAPVAGRDHITLVGGQVAASSCLVDRSVSDRASDNRTRLDLNVLTALPGNLNGLTRKIMYGPGDSTFEFVGGPLACQREAARLGMTLVPVGSVDISQNDASFGSGAIKGEGRGSREWGSYTGARMNSDGYPCLPFPDSYINTYNGLTTLQKRGYNPYLRLATSTDISANPAKCFTNVQDGQKYIFDFAFGLARLGLDNPDIVVIGLGTNNILHFRLPADNADVIAGLSNLIPSIRSIASSPTVILATSPNSRSADGDLLWPDRVILRKLQADYIAGLSTAEQAKVKLFDGAAYVAAEGGAFGYGSTVDNGYGSKATTTSNSVHYEREAPESYGRALFAMIGCLATGAGAAEAPGPSLVSFGTKMVLSDNDALYGLTRGLYFPRAMTVRGPGGSLTSFTVGTESTRIPGYTEVAVPDATSIFRVFVNRASGALSISAQNAPSALSDNLLPLLDVQGDAIFNNRVPFRKLQDQDGLLHFYRPLVLEEGHLLLQPQMRGATPLYNTLRPVPNTGPDKGNIPLQFEKEIVIAAGGTPQEYVLDHVAAAKGLDPFVLVTFPRQPDGVTMSRIASALQATGPVAFHDGVSVIGAVPGGSVPNIANLGQNGVTLADITAGGFSPADFTNPELVAAGFTKGFTSSATSAFYGKIISGLKRGEYRFVRFVVETDVDYNFPSMSMAYVDSTNLGRHAVFPVMESLLSPRSAIYSANLLLPITSTFTIKGIWVGASNFGGRAVIVGGLQIGASSRLPLYVMRKDFPPSIAEVGDVTYDLPTISQLAGKATGHTIIYPKRMYLVEGQKQTLYGDGLLTVRSDQQDPKFALEPRGILFTNDKPTPVEFKESTILIGGQLPAKINIMVRNRVTPDSGIRGLMPVDVLTASMAAVSGKTITAFICGDSVTEYAGWPLACRRELIRLGATFKTIGTVPLEESDDITGVEFTIPGEARASRTSTNFSYEADPSNSVVCEPFPDSYIATYLSLPKAGLETDNIKRKWNPMLRTATGADPSANIRQGQILDFANYMTRFNAYYNANGMSSQVMAQPMINAMDIGSNDYLKYSAADWLTRWTFVKNAHRDWAARSLAAWPTTKVVFMVNPLGRNGQGDDDFPKAQQLAYLIASVVDEFKNIKDGNGNPMVLWVTAMPHCSTMIGLKPLDPISVDAITGFTESGQRDATHVEGLAKEQQGILMAHVFACIAAGVA